MSLDSPITRKQLLTSVMMAAASTALPVGIGQGGVAAPAQGEEITLEDMKAMEKIAGISFTDDERKQLLASVRQQRAGYEGVRKAGITYETEPATIFTPLHGGSIPGSKITAKPSAVRGLEIGRLKDEDIAFLSVRELGHLIRTQQLSPVRLTGIYLARLKQYGDKLLCVVTLTEELARRQAKRAEDEINAGRYRGPLHGIPYGIKDLFTVKGYPTTWGANPYEHQVLDENATVVERLEQAGAILLAKLSMGALAMGDVWFRGRTKNPWNPAQGSSGSSAGSASATAAGLVAFGIGTETQGSITSPSNQCRITGLRPTYGRVSRHGAMALSYTMDKVGPLCRNVEDCAIVLSVIAGPDPLDPSAVAQPFNWPQRVDWMSLKIGYLVGQTPDPALPDSDPFLKMLKTKGAALRPIRFTPMPQGLSQILNVESASAFDEFTRSQAIRDMRDSAWPQIFRAARYVPAVEYLQAQRGRKLLMERFEQEFGDLDCYVGNGIAAPTIAITNLTGHPQCIIPWGVDANGNSIGKSFVGRLYQEDKLASIARDAQEMGNFHHLRPDLSKL